MAYINLLPWREAALKIQQKQFFSVLSLVGLFSFAITLSISFFYQAKIDGQKTKNDFLKNEVQLLDIRITKIQELKSKKIALQKRIGVIEQLQRSRNVGTQVLDEIAKIIPNGIYITRLEKKGNSLSIQGKSESNNHLANMIRAIGLSDLFVDTTLESIITDEKARKLLSDFKMHIRIKGLVDNLDLAVEQAFKGDK
jgi:type IV pilus assembly protein PilN|tara:strand:- start:601 stop:1191 length:591 start_codon:yes stop_codon:yes gene_type:complete